MDLSLFQVLATDACGGILPIVKFIRQGIFPIILIIMGSIDLGKAVLSSDDKEIKGATGRLIKRAIAAVAVFFVTTIVTILMDMLANTGAVDGDDGDTTGWAACWSAARN